jgi:hypothetical protein
MTTVRKFPNLADAFRFLGIQPPTFPAGSSYEQKEAILSQWKSNDLKKHVRSLQIKARPFRILFDKHKGQEPCDSWPCGDFLSWIFFLTREERQVGAHLVGMLVCLTGWMRKGWKLVPARGEGHFLALESSANRQCLFVHRCERGTLSM